MLQVLAKLKEILPWIYTKQRVVKTLPKTMSLNSPNVLEGIHSVLSQEKLVVLPYSGVSANLLEVKVKHL